MINYQSKIEMRIYQDAISITCDRCKKVIDAEDVIEWQEIYPIHFTGGYGSVFGDMTRVSCDLCQQCLKELIGDFCRCDDEEG